MSKLTRTRCSFLALCFALAVSALGAGAVHLPVLFGYALLVLVSAALAFSVARDPSESEQRMSAAATGATVCCLALAAVCLVQAIPLPASWLAALAPHNADVWARALRPFDAAAPSAASLSLAPGRGLVEALKFATYGLVFAVSAQLGRGPGGMRRIAGIAYGIALVVSLVTALHQLSGAEELYGAYRPLDAYSIAPLLNPNNRAGFLNLGFFCGLGLLFRSGTRPLGALIGIGLALIAAEILLCASVGGSASLLLGLIAVLLLPLRRGQREGSFELSRPLQLGVVVAIALAATFMAFTARRSNLGLDDRSTEKLELFARTWRLALDHPWFGIGRGAFASVFGTHQGPGRFSYEHAENFVLQGAAEWGLPVMIAALAAMGWALVPIARHALRESPTRRAALVGCGVLLLHNLVDLGLEVPAVAASFASVFGGLASGSRRQRTGVAPARLVGAGTALGAACLILAFFWGSPSTARMRHTLHEELAAAGGTPTAEFWAKLEGATLAYPAESYFPLLGSSAALAARQNPMPWINRALERGPDNAEAHVQLARILRARGATSQALGALRRAVVLDPLQIANVLRLGSDWQLPPRDLATIAPDGASGAALLVRLASKSEDERDRIELLEQAIERNPEQAEAHQALALVLVRDLERGQRGVFCSERREECLTRALEHSRLGDRPHNAQTGMLQARLLEQQGSFKEAEALLARTCDEFAADLGCRDALVVRALANDSPELDRFVKALVAVGCGNRERCAQIHRTLGGRFAKAGQWHVALGHYRHAVREAPSHEAWQALASAAERTGQESLAAEARRNMARLGAEAATLDPEKMAPKGLPSPPPGDPAERAAGD